MCGICGLYEFSSDDVTVDSAVIDRMTASMVHRGPDDHGYAFDGALGLGFRRLSIIDLDTGHQPMTDRGKTVTVVFNGEIYNHPELRRQLTAYGYRFRTSSDTEVIVHGYRAWGPSVLERLSGMFGLAIHDRRHNRLLVARDRMGIKPLYYSFDGRRLMFGSEIRALLAAMDTLPPVDPVALNHMLRYRYTPSPSTLFSGISKLAPGTMLVVENGRLDIQRWYAHRPEPLDPPPSVDEAAERLLDLYRDSVERHLLSDVPVGLLLSGGIDSGLLLALMAERGERWPTYTVGYGADDTVDDELSQAARTAGLLGADNVPVILSRDIFEDTLSQVIDVIEEPIASSSVVPMYHVCERARRDVKVVLMGQGPDELFGGYRRHLGIRYGGLWRSIPAPVRNGAGRCLTLLPRNEMVKRGVHALGETDRLTRIMKTFSLLPGERVDSLFRDGVLPADVCDRVPACWKEYLSYADRLDDLGAFQYIELRSSLPDELLMYADKLSMIHSLETRVPYLDPDIVHYVESLPSSYKIRFGRRKFLHRLVSGRYLPAEVTRRKKIGFSVRSVDQWFRESLMSRMERTLLDSDSIMYTCLREDAIRKLVREHLDGREDNHKILFSLVVVERWLRGIYSAGRTVIAPAPAMKV